MCDWEAEEYAEYLLWVEAEKARLRARARSTSDGVSMRLTSPIVPPTDVAAA